MPNIEEVQLHKILIEISKEVDLVTDSSNCSINRFVCVSPFNRHLNTIMEKQKQI